MAQQHVRKSLILSILSLLITMIAAGVLFSGTASANPVMIGSPPSYPPSLSRVLWDLTDSSRHGEWGRVVVYDQSGSGLHAAADAAGNRVPTFASRLDGSTYFADSVSVPDSMQKYLARNFGSGYARGPWLSSRGMLGISGDPDQLNKDELSMLGVRYLVATQPLGGWVQPQPYIPPTPPDNHDPNNRWPSLHDDENRYQPQPIYPPRHPLGNWGEWEYVQTVDSYYVYMNSSAWGRAEFVQSGSYDTRSLDENGIEINDPTYAIHSRDGLRVNLGSNDYRYLSVVRDLPGDIAIEAYGGRYQTGVVVLNEPIVDGWRATIDGKETKIKPVNSVLMGVELPTGRHTIEFRRAHSGIITGTTSEDSTLYFLAGFLVAALVAAILYFASARRRMFGNTTGS